MAHCVLSATEEDRILLLWSPDDTAPDSPRNDFHSALKTILPYRLYQNSILPSYGSFLLSQAVPCILPFPQVESLLSSVKDTNPDNLSVDFSVSAADF